MAAYKKKYNSETETRDYQKELTDKFINKIEDALANGEKDKWDKPWFELNEIPFNATTGEKYNGMNIAILASAKYTDPRWLTFNQMKEYAEKNNLDLKLEPGSKAEHIVRVVPILERDDKGHIVKDEQGQAVQLCDKNGNPQIAFKYMPVFNASCVKGMPPHQLPIPKTEFEIAQEVNDLTTALQEKTGLTFVQSSQARAYYSPGEHKVHMPNQNLFKSEEGYYATLLHEFGHSTGPALNRDMSNKFGSKGYASEELVAEISAAFTSMELGINRKIGSSDLEKSHENTKEYLQNWLTVLKNDTSIISKAANQASKATSYQMEHLKAYKQEKKQQQENANYASKKQDNEQSLGMSM